VVLKDQQDHRDPAVLQVVKALVDLVVHLAAQVVLKVMQALRDRREKLVQVVLAVLVVRKEKLAHKDLKDRVVQVV
jgi:hypothetical protein